MTCRVDHFTQRELLS